MMALFITAFGVLSRYLSLLPANPCKKKKKISSDILNVGGEEKTAWRGKHVRALWLNAALLAPNHLKEKKKKKKINLLKWQDDPWDRVLA